MYYDCMVSAHLENPPQVDDSELHWVGTIPELPQAIGLLLPQSIAVVLVHLSTIVEHNLNLRIVMLSKRERERVCVCVCVYVYVWR